MLTWNPWNALLVALQHVPVRGIHLLREQRLLRLVVILVLHVIHCVPVHDVVLRIFQRHVHVRVLLLELNEGVDLRVLHVPVEAHETQRVEPLFLLRAHEVVHRAHDVEDAVQRCPGVSPLFLERSAAREQHRARRGRFVRQSAAAAAEEAVQVGVNYLVSI